MTPRLQVSRQRLTRCPGCGRHIRLALDWADTRCPFCASGLNPVEPSALGTLDRIRRWGGSTGASVASAILAVGLQAACVDGVEPVGSGNGSGDDEAAQSPDSGANVDPGRVDAGPDGAQPDAGSDPDAGPRPDAGSNPDAGWDPDAGFGPDAGGAPDGSGEFDADVPPTPLYGLPPNPDGGVGTVDAGAADAGDEDGGRPEAGLVLLYGAGMVGGLDEAP